MSPSISDENLVLILSSKLSSNSIPCLNLNCLINLSTEIFLLFNKRYAPKSASNSSLSERGPE